MRKEFSVIGAFSMAISFVAAVVLCLEISQTKRPPTWQATDLVLWSVEIALFGTAVLMWRRRASLGGWIVGIIALALVRLALTAACALAASKLQVGLTYEAAMRQVSACEPRLAASLFSLMVFYPLRVLLPANLFGGRRQEARKSGIEAQGDAALWIVRGEEKLQVTLEGGNGKRAVEPTPSITTIVAPEQMAGEIQLPLRVILPRLPQDCLTARVAQLDPAQLVSIPLSMIVPQLREAQIFISLEEMQGLLPPNLLKLKDLSSLDGEPLMISLGLEEVVPALPSEVLELPPPSLPAWAELPDPAGVVFATVPK